MTLTADPRIRYRTGAQNINARRQVGKNARQWNWRKCHFSDAILLSPLHNPPHNTPQLFRGDLMQQTFHPSRRSFVFAGAAGASLTTIFEMAVSEGFPIAGAHVPFPGIGRLRRQGEGYAFDVVPWQLF